MSGWRGLLLRPAPARPAAAGPDAPDEQGWADGAGADDEGWAPAPEDPWASAPPAAGGRDERRAPEPHGFRTTLWPVLAAGCAGPEAGAADASSEAGRGTAVVVATWDPRAATPEPAAGTGSAAARRLRSRVAGVGADGVPSGRVVRVALPSDDAQAVATVERLADAGAPVVLVLAGPWSAAFLPLLEAAGRVHAAGSPEGVAAARRTLARHGVEVDEVPRPTGPVARALLRRGWTGPAQVRRAPAPAPSGEDGQALLFVLLALLVAMLLAIALGGVASAMGQREDRQRAVDLAALAAADRMRADWPDRAGAPAALSAAAYRDRATRAAREAMRRNGGGRVEVDFPGGTATGSAGPLQVRVRAPRPTRVAGVTIGGATSATAELAPPVDADPAPATGDEYRGPLARRDGKPMRPDVAVAYDRMHAAARRAGVPLSVTSGYRSNAEQAALFAAHPDPKWVAPPGKSLHRMGTELDLGPPAAYGWLARNAPRFGFKKRYAWEPWHYGYVRETGSAHVAEQGRNPKAPQTSSTIPPWVPARYRASIRAASVRYKVSAALLSAQLRQESGFDPTAVSSAGAQGIAQFMPGTAASMGLTNPFDPAASIHAQARLMGQLLRQFGSVQLALAAYNAGPGRVAPCQCVPPITETRQYVATIIALMRGYDPTGGLADVLAVRLVA